MTAQQFADIAAQEVYREPGTDLHLVDVLSQGRAVLGKGRYETLVCAGQVDDMPVLTFTVPWGMDDVSWVSPFAAYVRSLASGLLSAGVWDVEAFASYVAACPGAVGHCSTEAITNLLLDGTPTQ
ncbi:hypothetical protein ACIGO6_13125 [Streptomyces sp. NPDC053750]|uniref:hypothetical protein n=1 Tax=Streptomyces sp. NPDC053750 TaxID=3365714 RepID=UPI0037CE6EBC